MYFQNLKLELHRHTNLVFAVFVFCMGAAFAFLAMQGSDSSIAAGDTSGFRAGNIMSDGVMANSSTMSVSDIQSWLTRKNPCTNTNYKLYKEQTAKYQDRGYTWHWTGSEYNGHFVCLSEERFGNGVDLGYGQTAAEIIYEASQKHHINPQVLLVLLEKEQGLISDTYPNNIQYRKATGYGCPDTAACDSAYYGFKNQINRAAELFRKVLDGNNVYYPAGRTSYVAFNPNSNCGGTNVYIENRATSALYRYTPYQPNAPALSAGYGQGDSCSAYGNRNFYLLFTDWFGSTHASIWTAFETPRYLVANRSIIRINPITEQPTSESIISSGTPLYFLSKTKVGNYWCYRTEHNTIAGIDACVPESYVNEVSLNYQDVPSYEQYKIISAGASKMSINSRAATQTFSQPLFRRFLKKATFQGVTYYFTEFDLKNNSRPLVGFKSEDLTTVDYSEMSGYYVVNQSGVYKSDLLNLSSSSFSVSVSQGTVRLFKAKINIGGNTYYQTEYDYDNGIFSGINSQKLTPAYEAFVPFENPRALKLTKKVDRVDPITGKYYDTLSAGQVIDFSEKIYLNNQWYYRTSHNAAHGLYYAIPASATTEL